MIHFNDELIQRIDTHNDDYIGSIKRIKAVSHERLDHLRDLMEIFSFLSLFVDELDDNNSTQEIRSDALRALEIVKEKIDEISIA